MVYFNTIDTPLPRDCDVTPDERIVHVLTSRHNGRLVYKSIRLRTVCPIKDSLFVSPLIAGPWASNIRNDLLHVLLEGGGGTYTTLSTPLPTLRIRSSTTSFVSHVTEADHVTSIGVGGVGDCR